MLSAEADHINFKFFKCCLPQIFLGPFLNTLTHMNGVIMINDFVLAGTLEKD